MVLKPNTNQRCNQERNSHTSATGLPAAPARASAHARVRAGALTSTSCRLALLLVLILLVLLQHLKNLFRRLCLQCKRMIYRIPNMMKRKSPIDDYDQGKKEKAEQERYKKEYFCGICFDLKDESDMFRGGNCIHPFCSTCISQHVAAQIQQNILKVNCPDPNCCVELKPEYLRPLLPKEVIDRWEYARCESSIALSQRFYCPFKDCSGLLVNEGNAVTISECPYCHRLFCAECKVPWHVKMNCKEFQRSKRSKSEKDLDGKLLELAKSNMWQRCPKCTIVVQRLSGCEHMTCRCGCNFCYKCGKNWKFGHTCNTHRST